tara:strand:+ start:512 stop:1030 length:519 start_codon:yes stop_codon:yes gene_type:complete
MSVFNIKEVVRFTPSDLKKMGEELAMTHKTQAQKGIDAKGDQFSVYTPVYRNRKAAGKAAKSQISRKTYPPDLTLTGAMWKEWGLINTIVGDELFINYGIKDAKQAEKLKSLQLGRFGKKGRKVVIRKDKKRVVAANQKVGPEVEERIALLFTKNINKNLARLTNRPTTINL